MSTILEIYEREIKDREQLSRHVVALLRGAYRLGVAGTRRSLSAIWQAEMWVWKMYFRACVGICGGFFGLYVLGSSHAGHALQGEEMKHLVYVAFRWITAGWR
jgi:hypothetical protein